MHVKKNAHQTMFVPAEVVIEAQAATAEMNCQSTEVYHQAKRTMFLNAFLFRLIFVHFNSKNCSFYRKNIRSFCTLCAYNVLSVRISSEKLQSLVVLVLVLYCCKMMMGCNFRIFVLFSKKLCIFTIYHDRHYHISCNQQHRSNVSQMLLVLCTPIQSHTHTCTQGHTKRRGKRWHIISSHNTNFVEVCTKTKKCADTFIKQF